MQFSIWLDESVSENFRHQATLDFIFYKFKFLLIISMSYNFYIVLTYLLLNRYMIAVNCFGAWAYLVLSGERLLNIGKGCVRIQ